MEINPICPFYIRGRDDGAPLLTFQTVQITSVIFPSVSLVLSTSVQVESFRVYYPNLPHCRRGLANPDHLLNACLGSDRANTDLLSAQPVSLSPQLSEALAGQASTDCFNRGRDWPLGIIPVNYLSKRRRQSKHRCATRRRLHFYPSGLIAGDNHFTRMATLSEIISLRWLSC